MCPHATHSICTDSSPPGSVVYPRWCRGLWVKGVLSARLGWGLKVHDRNTLPARKHRHPKRCGEGRADRETRGEGDPDPSAPDLTNSPYIEVWISFLIAGLWASTRESAVSISVQATHLLKVATLFPSSPSKPHRSPPTHTKGRHGAAIQKW